MGGTTVMRRHRFLLALSALTLAGFGVRVVYVLVVAPEQLGFDAIWYELQSQTLAGGHGYVDPDAFYRLGQSVPTANFPPLWPLLLAGVSKIGLDGERAHQLVGAVLGSATVALTGLIGARVAGRRVAVLAAVFVAGSPLLIAADGSLMSESLFVALIAGATLAAYRAVDRPSWPRFALLGATLGLAALARSDALIVAPLLIGATAWRSTSTTAGRRVLFAGVALIVTGLVLSPWVVRNDREMGEPIALSSNSGGVLEGANCTTTYAGRLLGAWDANCLAVTRDPGQSELDWAAAGRRAGIDYARDHTSRLPLVGTARILRAWSVWNPVDQANLETIETRTRNWQLVGGVVASALLALAVPGTVVLVRRHAPIAPLVAVAVGVSIAALSANGNTRFTLAAQPAVAIVAAAFVLWLVRGQPSSEPTTETNETISPG
jgi:4-amino-4-deoxy-L-arabinose transferase-like glycosyltransferase